MRRLVFVAGIVLGLGAVAGLIYVLTRPGDDGTYSPHIEGPSKEAEMALSSFRLPSGMEARVWAAEPMLANPVSFCFDEKGRCYVAETFRLHHGVTDNRDHPEWVDDDMASRSVEDRVALYRKYRGDKFGEYETEHDRVRLLEDTKGAGKADKATVFADGFKDASVGLGAGVLARRDNVYYTCIPDLWLLKDTKGKGKADVRQSLAHGFGVHVCFFGHDLHGLRMGPDGRLYFSIGDRGFNVTTKEGKHLFNPDSGAVLRCEPDGSNLEVFATGLRNPQELAFDAYGNLFTVDNNSDSGDRARLVYIVEGGDSGWRTGYQYGSDLGDRGPFNAEKVWSLGDPDQPVFVVPPLAHFTTGPAGLCYNPGATALPRRYAGHFFVCDFLGASSRSGVWSFAVKPKGAAFEMTDSEEFIKGILATDCDFGPDGGFYVSDWVHGWTLTGKGRIYRFADAEAAKDPLLAEVKTLLADGFDGKSPDELAKQLGHADMRVRQEAQFALADKGEEGVAAFTKVAKESKDRLAQLHGIWGLGQLARGGTAGASAALVALLKDAHADVRAQAARSLADSRTATAGPLLPLLRDGAPRVRFFAALALAGTKLDREGLQAVVAMLRENADGDAYLRHAGALALAAVEDRAALLGAAKDESPAVRLAVAVALRRQHAPEVADLLTDGDPRVATEAARAIHDEPIPEGLPKLAALLDRPKQPELLLWRALSANYRLGKSENAAALAAFAVRADVPEKLRVEAVTMLGAWAKPGRRDRVTGLTQDLGPRDAAPAGDALRARLDALLAGPDELLTAAATAAGELGIKEVAPQMLDLASNTKRAVGTRVAALRALASINDESMGKATRMALDDAEPRVRAEGRRLLARANPGEGVTALGKALEDGELIEKQSALAVLGETKGAEADALLGKSLDRLLANDYPANLRLDLLEAAATRESRPVKDKLKRFEESRTKDDPLAEYREALAGGDAEAGRRVFFTKTEASCLRCHKVKGEGGGDVGPDLAGIGGKQTREYLLESIVDPNKQIAQGYESVLLTLTNGTVVNGVVKGEDKNEVKLLTADGKLVPIPRAKIDERTRGKSAMPDDVVRHLTKRELRDVVEYLVSLK
ncbi:MAG TPA: PVC-type heme-binding CxxCH protein [Gemmataceae bacterium]|nr:PVC-type heme-binding CxxCH protein [Gemmataceae bacterium]